MILHVDCFSSPFLRVLFIGEPVCGNVTSDAKSEVIPKACPAHQDCEQGAVKIKGTHGLALCQYPVAVLLTLTGFTNDCMVLPGAVLKNSSLMLDVLTGDSRASQY